MEYIKNSSCHCEERSDTAIGGIIDPDYHATLVMTDHQYIIRLRKKKTMEKRLLNSILKSGILHFPLFSMLSVVIPTRGDQNMKNIIQCLESQTHKDFEVIFVVDKILEKGNDTYTNKGNIKFITNLNSTFHPHNNASYNRNFGIDIVEGDFIQLMDDDERFPEDYLEKSMNFRFTYREKLGKDLVLTPTLMYRKTGEIQNQGFSYFSYWFSRPIPQKLGEKKRDYIQMYSGNSLLATAEIFRENKFDENIDFVYEDLDFSYNIHQSGTPIIVLKDLEIYHMEREKTLLEQARVGHELQAYKKSKHRIVFVRKHGNLTQRIQFYFLGLRAQPLRLLGKVLRYGKGEKWKIIRGMRQGFVDGIKKS